MGLVGLCMGLIFLLVPCHASVTLLPQVGVFSPPGDSFFDTSIPYTKVPDVLKQFTIIVVTPNTTGIIPAPIQVPTYVMWIAAIQEVAANDLSPLGSAVIPKGGPLTRSPTTVNSSTGVLNGESLAGPIADWSENATLELDFVPIQDPTSILLPGNVSLPLDGGGVKYFVRMSSNAFQWQRPNATIMVIVAISTLNVPLTDVTALEFPELHRVRINMIAGDFTLHYDILELVWIDDVPQPAYTFRNNTPTPPLRSFWNDTVLQQEFGNYPIWWGTFVIPAPNRSMLFDPLFSVLYDASANKHQSWMSRHRIVLAATVGGVILLTAAIIFVLFMLLRKGKLRTLWNKAEEEPYHMTLNPR